MKKSQAIPAGRAPGGSLRVWVSGWCGTVGFSPARGRVTSVVGQGPREAPLLPLCTHVPQEHVPQEHQLHLKSLNASASTPDLSARPRSKPSSRLPHTQYICPRNHHHHPTCFASMGSSVCARLAAPAAPSPSPVCPSRPAVPPPAVPSTTVLPCTAVASSPMLPCPAGAGDVPSCCASCAVCRPSLP